METMTLMRVIFLVVALMDLCVKTADLPYDDCGDLQPGQYYCDDPEIDPETQQALNCTEKRRVLVTCYPVEGIICGTSELDQMGKTVFFKEVSCKWTNGKKFSVALLLSIFLGWCGIDRFYLGYPAMGLVKFCTVGFMMLGSFIDVLLIATQVVGPADGSDYIVDYFGPGLIQVSADNYTYIKPPDYG